MTNISKIHYELLITKLKNVRVELEQINKYEEEIKKEFAKEFGKFKKTQNVDFVEKVEKEARKQQKVLDEIKNRKVVPPKNVSKIYKEIAKKIHPDKFANESLKMQEEHKEAMQKATSAIKEGDWISLLELADKFKVEISEPTEEQMYWIKIKIDEIQDKIQVKKMTFAWVWFHAEESKRVKIMDSYFKSIGA